MIKEGVFDVKRNLWNVYLIPVQKKTFSKEAITETYEINGLLHSKSYLVS